DKNSIPYTVSIGEEELNSDKIPLKSMDSGDQTQVSMDELLAKIRI
ncbi:MAG: histidyl-tRNA synthetase, partial [Flavobacteriales bacterium]